MLCWAYWGTCLPTQKHMVAKRQQACACTEAEVAQKHNLGRQKEEADRVRAQELSRAASAQARARYMAENPGYTSVRGSRVMVGPFSQGYEEMLAAEELESERSIVDGALA